VSVRDASIAAAAAAPSASPPPPATKGHDTQDRLLLVTDKAMYRCPFDRDTGRALRFRRVPLTRVVGLEFAAVGADGAFVRVTFDDPVEALSMRVWRLRCWLLLLLLT
jgi:hypothetical protein